MSLYTIIHGMYIGYIYISLALKEKKESGKSVNELLSLWTDGLMNTFERNLCLNKEHLTKQEEAMFQMCWGVFNCIYCQYKQHFNSCIYMA